MPPRLAPESARVARPGVLTAFVVLVVASAGGYGAAKLATPVVHNRYFPWIVGRGLGLAAYFALTLLVCLGIWLRHPWRFRWLLVRPETALRLHAALPARQSCWSSATLPLWPATVMQASVGSERSCPDDPRTGRSRWPSGSPPSGMPTRRGHCAARWSTCRRRWLPVHRLAAPIFATVFVHGCSPGRHPAVAPRICRERRRRALAVVDPPSSPTASPHVPDDC